MANTFKFEANRGFALVESAGSTLTNSTTETVLFAANIPAGKMGTSKILKFEFSLHLTSPALSVPTITLKLKLGATFAITLANAALLSASLSNKPILIKGKIANMNSTSSQYVQVEIMNNSAGTNILSSLGSSFVVTDATAAVDTTVDQTLALTAQFGALSSTTSVSPMLVELNLT
jgi:hypothetical protein